MSMLRPLMVAPAIFKMNVFSRAYVDSLFEDYQKDPSSLPQEWQEYFQNFDPNLGHSEIADEASFAPPSTPGTISGSATTETPNSQSVAQLQDRVDQLVRGFRVRGHLEAKIDPLGMPRETNSELHPESYGLHAGDLDKSFSARTVGGQNFQTLEDMVQLLRNTYCRSIGAQFMHIDDHDVRYWLQSRMESTQNRINLDRETQVRILTKLTDAVIFEEFVRRKYIGAKTFSLEGAETLIPLLDLALEKAGEHGVEEVVLGMAHRGRLNVLANIMGKRSENIFWGFDDPDPETSRGGGDVLYHLGHSSDWKTAAGKKVHISLCFNPSHLEFVNPVAMGRCRSKMERTGDNWHSKGMCVLIHGDAAFAGEGVVQESLNLSQLPGYKVGGTLHVILNNQVGFTTNPSAGRSTTYASDVAKMLQIPIFHVNGEDPEAVAQVVNLAMEFRRTFHRDVVIDMLCYRRLGHNEMDEPRFTQPMMYKKIDELKTVRDSYLERLLKMKEVTADEADAIATARREKLDREFEAASDKENYKPDTQSGDGLWSEYSGGNEDLAMDVDTGVPAGKLTYVLKQLATVPEGFTPHRKLVSGDLKARAECAAGNRPIIWPIAELAAFASLALEGHPVRLTGQDVGRGTFSQRHAVLYDSQNGARFNILQHIDEGQANVDIINSPLSETGVLGFDYGFSLDCPDGLVLWEAQFGDFVNAAQVIIDQFIFSAEDKWNRLSGLVMLLPHGFEGSGPEHCSGRIERFLNGCAEHNVQIAYPTTAAQHFHLLRRQVLRKWRKPLIVFTPKNLLRDPMVASELDEFTSGKFQRVLADPDVGPADNPDRILIASGKVAVDLMKERRSQERNDFAVIRVEQLYPFPADQIREFLESYGPSKPIYWVQEEPRNMGPWYFIRVKWEEMGLEDGWKIQAITRPESASPSTGSKKAHKIEQQELLNEAMGTANAASTS
jgi:2-oxoglutarate dehydrogenase E1 component